MWFPSHFGELLNVDEVHDVPKGSEDCGDIVGGGGLPALEGFNFSSHQLKTPLPHSRMPNTWSERRGEEFASSDEKGRRPKLT